jgi:hypothetical protein
MEWGERVMTLDEVICKLECRELVIKLMRSLDTHDKELWHSVLADDAKRHYGNSKNKDDLHKFWDLLPKGFYPVHLVTNITITPTGPDTAEGVAYGVAYNIFGKEDDPLPRPMPKTPSRVGRTNYTFRKTSAGWRISATEIPPAFIDDMKMPHRDDEFSSDAH